MTNLNTFVARVPGGRLTVIGLAALALIGSGILSLAALTSSFTSTVNYAMASVSLTSAGTASVSRDIVITAPDGTAQSWNTLLTLSNDGNVLLKYNGTATATGTLASKLDSETYAVTTAGQCPASGAKPTTGATLLSNNNVTTNLNEASFAGYRTIAPGATDLLCIWSTKASGTGTVPSDTGTQVLTLNAQVGP